MAGRRNADAGAVGQAIGAARGAVGGLVREAFLRSGLKGPEDVRAPTGIGGFEVSYDPADMIEHVRIGGAATVLRRSVPLGAAEGHAHGRLGGHPAGSWWSRWRG